MHVEGFRKREQRLLVVRKQARDIDLSDEEYFRYFRVRLPVSLSSQADHDYSGNVALISCEIRFHTDFVGEDRTNGRAIYRSRFRSGVIGSKKAAASRAVEGACVTKRLRRKGRLSPCCRECVG